MDGALTFNALPASLQRAIFRAVPVDTRMRCAEVSPSWRRVLADASVWTTLDVSVDARLDAPLTESLLRAAVLRARGQLLRLVVTDERLHTFGGVKALLRALAPSAVSLRELHTCRYDSHNNTWLCFGLLGVEDVRELACSLPALTLLECSVEAYGDVQQRKNALAMVLPLLRCEPPFRALALRSLLLHCALNFPLEPWRVLHSAAAACASLDELSIHDAPLDVAAMAVLVDAALTRRLKRLELLGCFFTIESGPLLACLLHEATLESFGLMLPEPLHDGHEVITPLLGALTSELRGNFTLRSIILDHVGLWDDVRTCVALLGALTTHPTLRTIILSSNYVSDHLDDDMTVGAALAALVEANSPALTVLDVSSCFFRDAALAPLLAALPHNTHLRTLNLINHSASAAFVRDVLDPAAAASGGVLTVTRSS